MMLSRRILAGAVVIATVLMPSVADAQRWRDRPQRAYRDYGRYDADWGSPSYREPRRGYASPRRGRCDRGDGGTILGAIAGGLLGNAAAGRHDRELGTIVGAGAGALAGRAIDRDC